MYIYIYIHIHIVDSHDLTMARVSPAPPDPCRTKRRWWPASFQDRGHMAWLTTRERWASGLGICQRTHHETWQIPRKIMGNSQSIGNHAELFREKVSEMVRIQTVRGMFRWIWASMEINHPTWAVHNVGHIILTCFHIACWHYGHVSMWTILRVTWCLWQRPVMWLKPLKLLGPAAHRCRAGKLHETMNLCRFFPSCHIHISLLNTSEYFFFIEQTWTSRLFSCNTADTQIFAGKTTLKPWYNPWFSGANLQVFRWGFPRFEPGQELRLAQGQTFPGVSLDGTGKIWLKSGREFLGSGVFHMAPVWPNQKNSHITFT